MDCFAACDVRRGLGDAALAQFAPMAAGVVVAFGGGGCGGDADRRMGMGLAAYFLSICAIGFPYIALAHSFFGLGDLLLRQEHFDYLDIFEHDIADLWRDPQPMMRRKTQ